MPWHRIPAIPKNCTVNGYRAKESDPMWTGLDFSGSEPRQKASIMLVCVGREAQLDVHLDVPWCHPEDRAAGDGDDGCRYRVRPKVKPGKKWKGKTVKSVAFERYDGKWWIAIETKE